MISLETFEKNKQLTKTYNNLATSFKFVQDFSQAVLGETQNFNAEFEMKRTFLLTSIDEFIDELKTIKEAAETFHAKTETPKTKEGKLKPVLEPALKAKKGK